MTIFRRLSKNTVNDPTILEASPSASARWLGEFENRENVVVSTEHHGNDAPEDDALSMDTVCSDTTVAGMDESDRTLTLAEAFSEFSVKMDNKDDSVLVSIDVPSDVPVEDLSVQVNDGILRVSGDFSEEEPVEQSFQLDEQSLDVKKMRANLSDGTLTIIAPKKDSEDSTLLDSLPILDEKPPKVSTSSCMVVIVDLPGVHKDEMHVSYANGKLRIAGSRHFGRVRSFKRTIPVDIQKFDADQVQTYLHQGRLAVIVPPKEERVRRTIEIETESVSDGHAPRAA